jgi:hypothetical protein
MDGWVGDSRKTASFLFSRQRRLAYGLCTQREVLEFQGSVSRDIKSVKNVIGKHILNYPILINSSFLVIGCKNSLLYRRIHVA